MKFRSLDARERSEIANKGANEVTVVLPVALFVIFKPSCSTFVFSGQLGADFE